MDYKKIKREARDFAENYNPTGLVPFPFDETIRRLGDVDLVYLKISDNNISGAIFFQDEKFTIIISAEKSNTRQYFTLAHEFGHYYLHRDWLISHPKSGFIDYNNGLDSSSALMRPDIPPLNDADIIREREANNFAAEIIMPADKVSEFWKLTNDIVRCADAFQVSKSAMAIRLEKLGLI